ncbi:MAG TPA: nucleotidyltransferase domain-containing protein, partial [Nonomuraea sp.]|nr:nucleotidyltransferase domain-containing protein [Nonomuraea sp.]
MDPRRGEVIRHRLSSPGEARSYAAARKERTADTDRWLRDLFRTATDGDHVSLVAVGSLGRGEPAPGSDLDLVLLHDGRPDVARIADRIWYPVWDSAVSLDHSVRTVEEAVAVARHDLKAVLGLIQARHVAGDPELTRKAREAGLAEWRADSRRRLGELRAAADKRAQVSGELAFLLEPDL